MNGLRCGYADGRWGQIHYRIAGAKPGAGAGTDVLPLLMLHPTPKSGWIYERLMTRLADHRLTIAPDTPGYGASAPPPSPPSIEDYAGQMFALMDALGVETADLLGYHTGSATAVAMAALRPERVRRLILVSLAAYDAQERADRREKLKSWRGPVEDGSHLGAMWDLLGQLCDPRVSVGWKHASLTENLRCGTRAPWGYGAVYGYDLQAALDRLSHPALILNPQDDLWAVTQVQAARATGGAYVELPGLGHGLFDLETARIASLIEEFLA